MGTHRVALLLSVLVICGWATGDSYTLSWSDPSGDEEGVYPTGHDFAHQKGLFDIEEFSVTQEANNSSILTFSFRFNQLPNPQNAPLGFTHPMIETYIHTGAFGSWRINKTGATETIGNSGVILDPRYTWKAMLEINGWEAIIHSANGRSMNLEASRVEIQNNNIVVRVPIMMFGEVKPNWSFTVLVGAYNYDDPDSGKFRKFKTSPSGTAFGGGNSKCEVQPNLVDVLTYPDAARNQDLIISDYCCQTKKQVIISPISLEAVPYVQSSAIRTIEREAGGNGCFRSQYETTPRDRYHASKKDTKTSTYHLQYQENVGNNLEEYGTDYSNLEASIEVLSNCAVRIQVRDSAKEKRTLPFVIDAETENFSCSFNTSLLSVSINEVPFGIIVTRADTKEMLFNSTPPIQSDASFRNLVFKDRYVEISTQLHPQSHLFGLGERIFDLELSKANETYSMWNIDQGTPYQKNLYGSHAFYVDQRSTGETHGVWMANQWGMDVLVSEHSLTYKMQGGIIDLFIFAGPTIDNVVRQYQQVIGRPKLPPFWSLGYHQCRWGYENIAAVKTVREKFQELKIPLDTIWMDIDYMDEYRLWTTDPDNFPTSHLAAFVTEEIHANQQQFVFIVDPGVKIDNDYESYTLGLEMDVFIKNPLDGTPVVGKVWPGAVSFVDFSHPDAIAYWNQSIAHFRSIIPFDGLWIDMNELSSFCDGHCEMSMATWEQDQEDELEFVCKCSEVDLRDEDFPPYCLGGGVDLPGISTISMASKHYNDVNEEELHNLNGYLETRATSAALEDGNRRSFVLSRSTFAGSGKYGAHWLGDNLSTWEDMRRSISGIINMNLFGIPFVGADICGFGGNSTAELCARWMQLGAFYPFSRNHNAIGMQSQEPYAFGKTVADISRSALNIRYSLLSFYYSKLYEVTEHGGMFIHSLGFMYPTDDTGRSIDTQFIIGKTLMVVPVLQPGSLQISAYFPASVWYNYFTGRQVTELSAGNSTTGNWLEFDDIRYDEVFVFQRAGTIVVTQTPALTSAETRLNPLSIIVARNPDESEVTTLNFYMDDGITKNNGSLSHWILSAFVDDDGIDVFYFDAAKVDYQIDGLLVHNITVYGVMPPCNLVLFNDTDEMDFTYDHHTHVLVVPLSITAYESFYITWGEAEATQPFIQRCLILFGSLLFVVALLSIVSVIIHYSGKYVKCPPKMFRSAKLTRRRNAPLLVEEDNEHVDVELDVADAHRNADPSENSQ